MKLRSILLPALFFIQALIHAQWTQQVTNTSSDFMDIHFLNDSVGFVVGQDGSFLKTYNRGGNWQLSIIDNSGPGFIKTVYAINTDTIFAGGTDHIFKSTDGGESWDIINSQLSVNELKFFSSQVGYAKVYWAEQCPYPNSGTSPRYKYYRTLDGALTWEEYDFIGTQYTYYAEMEIVSPNTGYIGAMEMGFWCGYWPCCEDGRSSFFRTTDGGLTWQEIDAGSNGILNDVTFLNGSEGLAIYEYYSPYGYGRPAELNKILQGGDQIQFVHELPDYNADKCFFANQIQGYYLLPYQIMKTTTEGFFWQVDYYGPQPLRDVELTENLEAYVIGYSGTILHQKIVPVTEPEPLFWLNCNKNKIVFPMTNINGESIMDFTLKATGNMDITMDISGHHYFPVRLESSTEFVQEIEELVIPAGHDTTVFVAFRPDHEGHFSFNLGITSNSTNLPEIALPLYGKSVCFLPPDINNDTLICYDTVWVKNNVTVNSGKSLVFCPGTVINFQGGYHINIDGNMTAIGTVNDSIRFTSETKWGGIFITGNDPADSVILKYCRISHCNRDVWPDTDNGGGLNISGTIKTSISHSTFLDCMADDYGGGIYCTGSGFSINNCTLYNCGAGISGGAIYYSGSRKNCITDCLLDYCGADYGGGIFLISDADSILMNCTIMNCLADYGAGVYLTGRQGSVYGCSVLNCTGATGGGIYSNSAGPSEISGCVIEECNADIAGGIYITGPSVIKILDCKIRGCVAETAGGGVSMENGADAVIQHCEISGNRVNHGNGGGIHIEGASPDILSNSITWNFIFYGNGSGIYCNNGSPVISSNMFFENIADASGGGIYLLGMEPPEVPLIIQNLFYNNASMNLKGGAIHTGNNQAGIFLNTISDNFGGGVYCAQPIQVDLAGNIIYDNSSWEVNSENMANTSLSYCNIKGGWPGSGTGNLNADPQFYGLPYYPWYMINIDYSLMPGSPCIDTGPTDLGMDVPSTDLAGNPRKIGRRIDIGAYENNFLYQSIDTGFCEGIDFLIEALPFEENAYDSCEWTFNGEIIPEAGSSRYLLKNPSAANEGYYQCLFYTEDDMMLKSRKIYLYDKGLAPVILEQPAGAVLHEGDDYEMVFAVYSPDMATTYQWFHNNGPLEGETERVIFFNDVKKEQQGTYKCLAENTCGGVFSAEALLQMFPSGIDEIYPSRLSVYPNPAGSRLTVESRLMAARLEIFDLYGRNMIQWDNISSFPFILDISTLNKGIFVLKMNFEDGSSATVRFCKGDSIPF